MDLGKPDEDFGNEKGNLELVYNSKKYILNTINSIIKQS